MTHRLIYFPVTRGRSTAELTLDLEGVMLVFPIRTDMIDFTKSIRLVVEYKEMDVDAQAQRS